MTIHALLRRTVEDGFVFIPACGAAGEGGGYEVEHFRREVSQPTTRNTWCNDCRRALGA